MKQWEQFYKPKEEGLFLFDVCVFLNGGRGMRVCVSGTEYTECFFMC